MKCHASSHLVWLYSPVCVGPGWKPRRPVFSQRGSFLTASAETPLVTIEQDVYMPESDKKQNDSQSLTSRDRKSSGNNLKEESNDELNMTGSEQMNITGINDMSRVMRKPAFWFPTRSDTNQTEQLQKMARGLKFRI